MSRTINVTDTSTPGSGATKTGESHDLYQVDGTTLVASGPGPWAGVSDGALKIKQTVTQSDTQQTVGWFDVAGRVTNLVATPVSDTQINLTWTDVGGETGYDVYDTTAGPPNITTHANRIAADLLAGSASYSVTGLTASTLYKFQVLPTNASGGCTAGNEASATTNATAGPTVYARDDFAGADNDLIGNRTPTWQGGAGSGGTWVKSLSGTGTNRIYGNTGGHPGMAAYATGGVPLYHQDEIPVADYALELGLYQVDASNITLSLRLRFNPTSDDGYWFYKQNTGWSIYKKTAGAQALLGTAITDAAVSGETGTVNTYRLEVQTVSGVVHLRIFKNGVQVGTDRTDSSSPWLGATGARYVGFFNDGGVTTGQRIVTQRVLSLT